MIRLLLRTMAVLIAIAAAVDPSWPVEGPEPQRLVAIDVADGGVDDSIAALRTALPGWEIASREGGASSIPCNPSERCIVIADGSVAPALPADLERPPSLLVRRSGGGANVALTAAAASATHMTTAGAMRVELRRAGAVSESTVVLRDGDAVVGSATHKWSDSATTAIVDVAWWPLDTSARSIRVEVRPFDGEATIVDNVIDIGVPVLLDRVPVLVFDARPSWSSTFIRRALEDDPRVAVEHRARVAPSLSAGTRGAVLDASTLERTPVTIVGDPDALTAGEVGLLERYVRVRGGSLILLPERRIGGPAARLLTGDWSEHLVPAPERVGPLLASELLRATNLPPTAKVLARSGTAAAIVSSPHGEGRVLVSGAMDAWRYRSATFDDFWRSTVVEAGIAGTAVRIEFDGSLASTGERAPFTIRHRSFEARSAMEVTATAACGAEPESAVRIWPSGAAGSLHGVLPAHDSHCVVRARVADRVATAQIAISNRAARGVDATLTRLEQWVSGNGGVVGVVGEEAAIARALITGFTPTSRVVSVRPMRAMWWMFPFAGCLAAEWWLRRREGSA